MAILNGHTETVRVLLEAGALLERSGLEINGEAMASYVHVAIACGQVKICCLLLQAMAFEAQAAGGV